MLLKKRNGLQLHAKSEQNRKIEKSGIPKFDSKQHLFIQKITIRAEHHVIYISGKNAIKFVIETRIPLEIFLYKNLYAIRNFCRSLHYELYRMRTERSNFCIFSKLAFMPNIKPKIYIIVFFFHFCSHFFQFIISAISEMLEFNYDNNSHCVFFVLE